MATDSASFDEQIKRLTERHEALTQTTELIAAMQLENAKAIEALTANSKRDGKHILALVRIAELHDRRLSNLEG